MGNNTRSVQIGYDAVGNTIITGDGNVVVIEAVQRLAEPPVAATALGPNPYKGLAAFDEDDAERFFGREALTDKLWEALRALQAPVSASPPLRLLAVVGPSGCGKSSVVRAGLVPELARRPLPGLARARVAVLTPGAHPLESLATVLARIATGDPAPVAKTREFAEELGRPPHDGLRRIGDTLPGNAGTPLIVLVDQFEETYALCQDAAERDAFIANLMGAAADRGARVTVVLTLRSDFLGATMRHPALNAAIADPSVLVPAMGEDELRRAIAEPARRAGHPLDEATVDRLIADTLGREGALPLLEFTLTRIWEGLVEGKTPTETLRALGGVGGALAGEAERLFGRLTEPQQQMARRAFLALVRLGEGARDTRRRAVLPEMVAAGERPEEVQAVLGAFARAGERLVTLSAEGGEVCAEVTHEALFEHWARLQGWLTTGRDDLRFHRRLAEATEHWDAAGRPDGLLWRPPDLDLLEAFQRRAGADMTALEVDFHRTSRARERARRLAKRVTVSAVVLLLATAVGFGLVAERQLQEAEEQHTLARARELAARATLVLGNTGDGVIRSLLLGTESLHRRQTLEGQLVVATDLDLLRRPIARLGYDKWVKAVTFSPDGTRLATASWDSTRLLEVTTGKELARFTHEGSVEGVAFSPDGTRLATASRDSTARLWEVATGKELARFTHEGSVEGVAFSPDGTRLATASRDSTARLWEAAARGRELARLPHDRPIDAIAFAPDGTRLATASDTVVRLWDVSAGKEHAVLRHDREVTTFAFSADSRWFVTGGEGAAVRVWDLGTASEQRLAHDGEVRSIAFSPDQARLAILGLDGVVRLWDVASGKALARFAHEQGVLAIAFSPTGNWLATGSVDKTARVWDLATGTEQRRLPHETEVQALAFSPDGARLATVSSSNTVYLWDPATGEQLARLVRDGPVTALAFSPDSKWLATGGESRSAPKVTRANDAARFLLKASVRDLRAQPRHVVLRRYCSRGQCDWAGNVAPPRALFQHTAVTIQGRATGAVRLWDVAIGREGPYLSHDRAVTAVAFSPDGRYLATASLDKTARLWDSTSWTELHRLAHDSSVLAVAFSPDGTRLATGSSDKNARLWDVATGEELAMLTHEGSVRAVGFSPNGEWVATVSEGGFARVWLWRTEDLIEEACRRLERNLTRDEWHRYLGDEPYRPTCRTDLRDEAKR